LAQVKQHAATIEKLKSADPRAYEAVKNIVSAMIVMAQNMAENAAAATPAAPPQGAEQPQGPEQAQPTGAETPSMPEGAPAAKSEDTNLEVLEKTGKPGAFSRVPITSQAKIKRPTRKRGRGPRRRLPVGTVKGNKVKVKDPATGKSKWITPK